MYCSMVHIHVYTHVHTNTLLDQRTEISVMIITCTFLGCFSKEGLKCSGDEKYEMLAFCLVSVVEVNCFCCSDSSSSIPVSSAAILVISILLMGYVDTSAIYHIVRAQSVIKLYVIYNMLEVQNIHVHCTLYKS